MLFLFGCEKEEEKTPQAYFGAEVLEVNENNLWVKVVNNGNTGISIGEEFYVTKNVESSDGCPVLSVGDLIKVYFNGDVMETYPLQLGKVYSIEIIEKNTPDWGIKLTAENVTATGLTIICKQSGGSPSGELMTGSYYSLETKKDGEWEKVPVIIDNASWTDEAWLIPMNDTVTWDVDWSWLYGELSVGEYRIGKEIMDFRKTADYDKAMFYAEFYIVEYTVKTETAASFSYAADVETYSDNEWAQRAGFVNTSETKIGSMQDAIERAKAECTVYYDSVWVSYDDTKDVWRVNFGCEDVLGGGQSVYLDSNGMTLLIVYGE